MGHDKRRFKNDIYPQLICPICSDVIDEPYEIRSCEHSFCKKCIEKWLPYENVCNVCRKPATESDLKPAPMITRSLLAELLITCDFEPKGCEEYFKLDQLPAHVKRCQYNPGLTQRCPKNCGAVLKRVDVDDAFPPHECVSYLLSQAKGEKDDKTKMGLIIEVVDLMQEKLTLQQKKIAELRAKVGLKNGGDDEEGVDSDSDFEPRGNSGPESLATSYFVKVDKSSNVAK